MNLIAQHRKQIGGRIFTARKEAALTLDGLAEKIGSSRQHLIRLERGDHTPTQRLLDKIAAATGKDVAFFNGDSAASDADEDDEEADPVSDLFKAFVRFVDHRVKDVRERDVA